jgi:acetate---CoA ligase (ADP-forming)
MSEPAGLRSLLAPRSIAMIGASERSRPAMAILDALAAFDYQGRLYLVNPRAEPIRGRPAARTVGDLPPGVDLALVIVPAAVVPSVVKECAASGVASAVVFSSGFAEEGEDGARLQAELLAALSGSPMRVLGPNSEGLLNVGQGIPVTFSSSASFEQVAERVGAAAGDDLPGRAAGPVAVVGQSGGLAFSLFNRGLRRGIRFSYVVATGNEADLEVQDVLEFLLDDERTRVIVIYLEGLKDPRRFASIAARAQQLGKTLIVGKVGRSRTAARAALSHTGHLAGDDAAYQAMFDRYGVISVRAPEELLDAALAVSTSPVPAGNRTAIVSLSGGSAVWMADACEEAGLELPELRAATSEQLSGLLPSYASTGNPVDVSGTPETPPAQILSVIADDPGIDSLILVSTLARSQRLDVDLPALRQLKQGSKPVFLHSYTDPEAGTTAALTELGIPLYLDPVRCARSLSFLTSISRPPDDPPAQIDEAAVRAVAARLRDTADISVPEYEATQLLAAAGITSSRGTIAGTADEAVAAARAIGYPVALKIQSPGIPHKARAGGVVLNVDSDEKVRAGYAAVLANAAHRSPDAEIRGVLVQQMIEPGVELILGAHNSPDFGPMTLIGLGGSAVELVSRRVLYPAPAGPATATRLLRRIGLTPEVGDLGELARLVALVSSLAATLADSLMELDLNPVIWIPDTGRCAVVDALAILR